MIKKIDAYIDEHLEESIDELTKLCAQPSIAAQNLGIDACANLVGGMLKKRGFVVEIVPTAGAPVVIAERKGRSNKTLISYNHYDVQPPEPLELWESPAFEPTVRNGRFYARGAADNKGNIVGRLYAIDAILNEDGELPCTVKFVIEGEEEISSVHLHEFVKENQERLAGDACVWEIGGVDFTGAPIQMIGLRGICYVELSIQSASDDVHSGTGGSIFPNAAWRLVWALNSLKGPDEHIRLPGFYDDVEAPTEKERALMAKLPDKAEYYKKRYNLKGFLKGIEGGLKLALEAVYQPTCTICGLTSGYQGPGSKTVLPAKASAKVDFRLVPNQTPEKVLKQLRAHLDAEGFDDVIITFLGGEEPAKTDPDDPIVRIAVEAAADVYEQPTRIIPMIGGSGPNFIFQKYLGVPIISSGSGDSESRAHAPNESISLDLHIKGAKHFARVLYAFGKSNR